jgi:ubiquinone/menaquinone biosynthesis C-methylase UbiE
MIEARGSREAINRAYDLFSPFYGWWAALTEQKAEERGLLLANVRPGEKVLEVAVGTGWAFERLAWAVGSGGEAVGMDLSARMLKTTRRHLPGARLVRADARSLPFRDLHFDLVWSAFMLDLIPSDEIPRVLVEFRRVLAPGGRLALVSLSKTGEGDTWWERAYRATPSRLVPYVFGGCRPVQLAGFVREAGFARVARELVVQGMCSEIVTAERLQ